MERPTEPLKNEGPKPFSAFQCYLDLGPGRSLSQVAQRLSKSQQLVKRWSARWRWTERVTAHAGHLATVEREATEALARGKSAEWLRRQQKLREREWEVHEKCLAAAERGLKTFMEREKAFTSLADIARILEVASKLGRMASGLATDSVQQATEVNVNFRAEVAAAVRKVYGEPVEVEVVADRPRLPDAGS